MSGLELLTEQVRDTALWSETQPSISELRREAEFGPWTVSDKARTARLVWLYAVTVPGRIPPWLVHRVVFGAGPKIGDAQPPLGDLLIKAHELGSGPLWAARLVLVPTRLGSWTADYAKRTALVGLFVWMTLNAVNGVPGLRVIVPDAVTAAHWWQIITGAAESTVGAIPTTGSADVVAVIIVIAAVAVWGLTRLRKKGSQ